LKQNCEKEQNLAEIPDNIRNDNLNPISEKSCIHEKTKDILDRNNDNVVSDGEKVSTSSISHSNEETSQNKPECLLKSPPRSKTDDNNAESKRKIKTEFSQFDFDMDFSPEQQRYQPLRKKFKEDNKTAQVNTSCCGMSSKVSVETDGLDGATVARETSESLCEENKVCDRGGNSQGECGSIDNLDNKPSFKLDDDDSNSRSDFRPFQRRAGVVVDSCDSESCKENFSQKSNVCFPDDDSNSNLDANHEKFFRHPTVPENKEPQPPQADVNKTKPRVVYVHNEELRRKTNTLIRIENRAELVHSLIRIYGLLKYIKIVEPRPATDCEILGFHCADYISCLKSFDSFTDSEEIPESLSDEAEAYGLSYDCPQQTGVFETASLIGGASITAAEHLLSGDADIAINWYGGWHHAKRDCASGFCYINDIVLATLKLREKFDHILYVDLDLHHGDGVEEAFEMTPKVMTVSFHKFASGFFPGSGHHSDIGTGKGRYHAVNVPLKDGIRDTEFFAVFKRVMKMVKTAFPCEALVVQCGADGLAEDPMASFNLTHIGLAKCVCYLLAWRLPTLLLGGGGYNFANTAKAWTFLTGLAAGKKLPTDIPEHEHLLEYGPGYELNTSAGNRKDLNTSQYLTQLIKTVQKNLSHLNYGSVEEKIEKENIVKPVNNMDGNIVKPVNNMDGNIVKPVNNMDGNIVKPVVNMDGNIVKPVENMDGNIVKPVEKMDGNIVKPVENMDGNIVKPVENMDGNIVKPAENMDGNIVKPVENLDGNEEKENTIEQG